MTSSVAYSARNESLKLSILLTCLCLAILYGDWLWRWDRLIYDAQSSLIEHRADEDIVIIAIDETSLSAIGRWPWQRDIHAKLIDQLTDYQAKAVLIDVIFSESTTNSQSDLQLAQAIHRNKKVVLPVLLEQTRLQGQLLETLPLPELTQAAADLGHVHVELDADGIARGYYLYEGLGEARWPHIGMSVLTMLDEVDSAYKTQNQNSENINSAPWTWVRKDHFLIPFIGPPGSYKTTSYINVLNGEVLPETLKDKIVLIGVTAAGLGDSLPTPVSGLARAMPGIEINANIVQALKSGTLIKPVTPVFHYFIAGTLVLLTVVLFTYLTPRMTLFLVSAEVAALFLISLILLHWFHIWIPLSATILCLLLSYPLWAWRRLEFTVKYLNSELENLSVESSEIERYVALQNEQPFVFLQNMIPINGLSVFDANNDIILRLGEYCNKSQGELSEAEWKPISDFIYARNIFINHKIHSVYIRWSEKSPPDKQQDKILKTYIRQRVKPTARQAKTTVELIESRIRDIQTATEKLVYLRQFVTDSLEQMADGVIVIDSLGSVTLVNRQASKLLSKAPGETLLHQPINPVLDRLTITSGESWQSITSSLLSNKHYENLQVRTANNKDLVINISPLHITDGAISGFIINLSDITEIKDAQRKRNEILSFLSHDLRSPLVSVLAMLEKNKLNKQQNELSSGIEHNINYTIELAENFVHLSRVESDDEISFNSINMSDVIANAIDTVWEQANKKQIPIHQNLSTDGWVSGNGAMLERVMINLLTNAIKYSDIENQITVSLEKEHDTITCCVQDNGPGISEDDISCLFDRFKRAKQHSKQTSTESGIGLGLAFVHAAIGRHHGSITVDSRLGKGSRFCIKLPEEPLKNS